MGTKEKTKKTEVAVHQGSTGVAAFQSAPAEALLSKALDKGVSIETIEKLLAMRRELKAEAAKEAFNEAMARFQSECPVIEKKKEGGKTKGGSVAYKYAPLDSIVEQVKELLGKHGLSYAIKAETKVDRVDVTCIAKHVMGHAEETHVDLPLGTKTDIMSAPQVVAAAITFAKRYAFQNAFGIMTGDEDNDGQIGDSQKTETSAPAPAQKQWSGAKKTVAKAPSTPPPGMESDVESAASVVAGAFGGRVTDVEGRVKPPPVDEPFPSTGKVYGNCEAEGCVGSYVEKRSAKGPLLGCSLYPNCKSMKPLV